MTDCNICGKALASHRDGLACCHSCGGECVNKQIQYTDKKMYWCPSCVNGMCPAVSLQAYVTEATAAEAHNRRAETVAERELAAAKAGLAEIVAFGHGGGHGCGYTCANMAKELLAKLEAMK